MTALSLQSRVAPAELHVLTFSVMGIKIGIDADQISEIMDSDAAEARELPVSAIHEKIFFPRMTAAYRAPKVVIIKDGRTAHALKIEMPDDIVSVHIENIQPLPALIVMNSLSRALWAAFVLHGEPVFLLDFSRLADPAA